ncbi:MAG: bifunctional UDP-N-acetylglucosamine diphosphorylase/glucosamine-1-phosphate N-acetyltransferase GlmU [Betaproteobacteria bacterium]|jgi:bifunctional UDP-N-acetylglucosamine pyrophosphorylase/glucosamine-1-phosphate N-acetyltransferase|nr:UDP-N-acetylglucosamine diphosphorylase/glucosamine-1-phosphate N-acetyltransferase [Betaproteobacteria bacterium]
MNIVILAAGQGKRMQSSIPKVLHPLAGKPMLGHVLDAVSLLADAENIQPCVVIGHGGEAVQQYLLKDYPKTRVALQNEQKGTGHAVIQGLHQEVSEGITLVLYGDVPLIQRQTLKQLLDIASDGALALLTQHVNNPTGYGRIVRNLDGEVVQIVEEKDADAQVKKITEINTGILACPTQELNHWLAQIEPNNTQGEYYLTDIVSLAANAYTPIRTTTPTFDWETQGVNSRAQLALLERVYQGHLAQELLDSGVTIVDPARIDIRGSLECEPDVFIDIGCIFEGSVRLNTGVRIGPYCQIKNSTIDAGTQVHAFTHIDGAKIARDAVIGPYARIRPGAQIADQVHIGNFVEVKNADVGKGSKANHLSYIGDATVGEGVNIGAGTITCNYDGANKHRTVIEDGAFIGSDTQLVAPVRVGKNATIGAGTTLTKDAPAQKLTISRTKQASIDWQRPIKNKLMNDQ